MELKGSRTEQNLMTAFAGESMARNKYDYFASAAKKEGYEQVAAFFAETALNEKEHAKMWLRALAGFADGKTSGDTVKNLAVAAAGEHEEWTTMYKEFARIAREEGFIELAEKFEGVASIERAHEERYNKLRENLEQGKAFKQSESKTWHCRNCGFIYEGEEAPEKCPVCNHPQAYFELVQENY